MGVGSRPPGGASIVRPRTEELLIKQDTASCGQASDSVARTQKLPQLRNIQATVN